MGVRRAASPVWVALAIKFVIKLITYMRGCLVLSMSDEKASEEGGSGPLVYSHVFANFMASTIRWLHDELQTPTLNNCHLSRYEMSEWTAGLPPPILVTATPPPIPLYATAPYKSRLRVSPTRAGGWIASIAPTKNSCRVRELFQASFSSRSSTIISYVPRSGTSWALWSVVDA